MILPGAMLKVFRFVALAWKDPNNITEELAPETAKKGK